MKKTIKQLESELAVSQAEISRLKSEDERVRRVLSEMLDSYEYITDSYSYSTKPKKAVIVESWEGIAFLMGELKADADYAMCLEREEMAKQEVQRLKAKIEHLTSPKDNPHSSSPKGII